MMILEDDHFTVAGLIAWTDCEAFPLRYLLEITPNLLKKIVYTLQHCYPIEIEEVKCLNAPMGFATLFNVMKSFMTKDMKNKVSLIYFFYFFFEEKSFVL